MTSLYCPLLVRFTCGSLSRSVFFPDILKWLSLGKTVSITKSVWVADKIPGPWHSLQWVGAWNLDSWGDQEGRKGATSRGRSGKERDKWTTRKGRWPDWWRSSSKSNVSRNKLGQMGGATWKRAVNYKTFYSPGTEEGNLTSGTFLMWPLGLLIFF